MALLALGLNHATPLELRERVAFMPDSLPGALVSLRASGAREAAILSTCNRTELYCDAPAQQVSDWLARFSGVRPAELQRNLYVYPDARAVRHVMRVACGMDSMVPGEPQVFGQLKQAYRVARRAGTVETLLSRLFHVTFATAKQVRSQTAISHNPVSIATVAIRLAQQVFGALDGRTALFIGAGDTVALAARHIAEQGCRRIIIANRTRANAAHLARTVQGQAVELSELYQRLAEADIVVSSTGAPGHVLTLERTQEVLRAARERPVLVIDLAVPRDVDPRMAEEPNVYLHTVDDLKSIIDRNLFHRQQAGTEAEAIIDNQVQHFMDWLHAREAVPAIQALRQHADRERHDVLARAAARLRRGEDPLAVLERATHRLTGRLLHLPMVRLREEACRNVSPVTTDAEPGAGASARAGRYNVYMGAPGEC